MQQHVVASGELTLNYKMNAVESFNLFEITGTCAGKYLQNTGSEMERKKIPEGESNMFFSISTQETQWGHCQRQEAGALFSPLE